MKRTLRGVSFGLILSLLSALILTPNLASAARKPTNPLASIPVTGTVQGLIVNITNFVAENNRLVAQGTVTNAAGDEIDTFAAPVEELQVNGDCTILHLEIGPIELDLLGLVITTNRIVIDITAEPGPGNLLGNLLCAIAGLLDPNGGFGGLLGNLLNQLVGLLNDLLDAIGGATSTATSGTFTGGLLNVSKFVAQNGAVAAVGTLTSTTGQLSEQVTTQLVQANGTCEILHLELGPIKLDLLGLVITTNQIVIDITAESGPGNLLGNLLCGIANLLNGSGSATGLANLLNQLLRLFR